MGAVSLLLLVRDRQTVAILVEDLDAVTAAIHKQEKVTGRRVLGERGGDQGGARK
jgi:hypothetical protein